jgi:hypothetical protein
MKLTALGLVAVSAGFLALLILLNSRMVREAQLQREDDMRIKSTINSFS